MSRLLTLILVLITHCCWAILSNLDQHGEISSKKVLRYDSEKLFLENEETLDKCQVRSIIFPEVHTGFTIIPQLADSKIAEELTHLKASVDSNPILKQTTTIEYLPNGQSKETTRLILKLNRQNLTPSFLEYDPLLSDLTVKNVQLCTPNKLIKKLSTDTIRTIRLTTSSDKVLVYPKVEFHNGTSLLYVEYELIKPFKNSLIDATFQQVAAETNLTIWADSTKVLNFNTSFGTPTTETLIHPLKKYKVTAYNWSINLTPNQPKKLYYTSYSKWETLISKYQKLLQITPLLNSPLTPLVAELTKETVTKLEKTERLYNWVQTNIMLDRSSRLKTPELTLENKVANFKSRVLLFAALLKQAGINNELVLVIPNGLPIVSDHFQNLLCKVKIEEVIYYLDFKTGYTRFPALNLKLQGALLLNLTTHKIGKLRNKSSQFFSKSDTILTLKLAKSGLISTKTHMSMRGQIESMVRENLHFQHLTMSDFFCKKVKVDQKKLQNSTQVDAYDFSKSLTYQTDYSRNNQWVNQGDKMLIFIPELEYLIDTTPTDFTFKISINIPDGYTFSPPNELSVDNDQKQILHQKITTSNKSLTLEISFTTIDLADSQKAMIINELKKAIVLDKLVDIQPVVIPSVKQIK